MLRAVVFDIGGVLEVNPRTGWQERWSARLGLDPPALRAFMDDVWEKYVGSLNEELARYFAALRPRHRTGILSNSFVGAREREQVLYGFEDMCDVVVYSHEEGVKKPDRRIYEIACRRLGVAPHAIAALDALLVKED